MSHVALTVLTICPIPRRYHLLLGGSCLLDALVLPIYRFITIKVKTYSGPDALNFSFGIFERIRLAIAIILALWALLLIGSTLSSRIHRTVGSWMILPFTQFAKKASLPEKPPFSLGLALAIGFAGTAELARTIDLIYVIVCLGFVFRWTLEGVLHGHASASLGSLGDLYILDSAACSPTNHCLPLCNQMGLLKIHIPLIFLDWYIFLFPRNSSIPFGDFINSSPNLLRRKGWFGPAHCDPIDCSNVCAACLANNHRLALASKGLQGITSSTDKCHV